MLEEQFLQLMCIWHSPFLIYYVTFVEKGGRGVHKKERNRERRTPTRLQLKREASHWQWLCCHGHDGNRLNQILNSCSCMNFDSNIRPRNGPAAWTVLLRDYGGVMFFSPRGVSIDCAIFLGEQYECIIQKETGWQGVWATFLYLSFFFFWHLVPVTYNSQFYLPFMCRYQSWSPCRLLSFYNDDIIGIDLPPCNNQRDVNVCQCC